MSHDGPVGAFFNPGSGYSVPLPDIIREFELENATPSVDAAGKSLCHASVNRPALQLAGYYECFEADRLQIIGNVEQSYLLSLPERERSGNVEKFFSSGIPAVILCRKLRVFPEMLEAAERHGVPILTTADETMDLLSELNRWMKVQLAPRLTMHGCLLDVYGVGVMIVGKSGVGKSETALELIKRGHRFVADDAVEVRRVSQETLIGSCPENIRYFLELRGIGIVDVMSMFGVQAIKPTQSIELVLNLEFWDSARVYDRLGMDAEHREILGNKVRCCSIPIRPGRNLSILCESAAISYRQKSMGYNAASFLTQRIMRKRVYFD